MTQNIATVRLRQKNPTQISAIGLFDIFFTCLKLSLCSAQLNFNLLKRKYHENESEKFIND